MEMGLESGPESLLMDSVYPSVKWEGEASALSLRQRDDVSGWAEQGTLPLRFLAGEPGRIALPCKLWSVGKNQIKCTNCAKLKY